MLPRDWLYAEQVSYSQRLFHPENKALALFGVCLNYPGFQNQKGDPEVPGDQPPKGVGGVFIASIGGFFHSLCAFSLALLQKLKSSSSYLSCLEVENSCSESLWIA